MLTPGDTLFTHYEVKKPLGKGGFASVFRAKDLATNTNVAVKVESRLQTLPHEVRMLQKVASLSVVPKVVASGWVESQYCFVMNELGTDLYRLRKRRPDLGSHANVLKVAWKLLNVIEQVHDCGVMHLDIKPDNVVLDKRGNLSLIDFGLAQMLNLKKRGTDVHMGSPLFCSTRRLEYQLASRKDDIESWLYTVMFLVSLRLPWDKYNIHRDEKSRAEITHLKRSATSEAILCNLPVEFVQIHSTITSMKAFERPQYNALRELLERTADRLSVNLEAPLQVASPKIRTKAVIQEPTEGSETLTLCSTPKASQYCPTVTSLLQVHLETKGRRERRASAFE